MSQLYQAILLIAFGGPTVTGQIRPFLARVTQGIRFRPNGLEEVAHHYEAVGGKSPLNEITFRQARALAKLLHGAYAIAVFSRHAQLIAVLHRDAQANGEQRREKCARVHSLVAPNRSELGALSEKYRRRARGTRRKAPLIDTAAAGTIIRFSFKLGRSLSTRPMPRSPPRATKHYAADLHRAQLAERYGVAIALRGSVGYQRANDRRETRSASLVTGLSEPQRQSGRSLVGARYWRRDSQTRRRGPAQIVIAPIGFVCDHVEILYDLDIEAKKIAEALKINLVRASCPTIIRRSSA